MIHALCDIWNPDIFLPGLDGCLSLGWYPTPSWNLDQDSSSKVQYSVDLWEDWYQPNRLFMLIPAIIFGYSNPQIFDLDDIVLLQKVPCSKCMNFCHVYKLVHRRWFVGHGHYNDSTSISQSRQIVSWASQQYLLLKGLQPYTYAGTSA